MIYLIISFLSLIAAPLLYRLCVSRADLTHLLDGFIFAAIGGLLLFGVLPEALTNGGWVTLLFLVLGLVLPVLSERVLHRGAGGVHRAALILGLTGLFLHAMTDGAALASSADSHGSADFLAFSVLLHRLPIALTIWWFVYPQYGNRAGVGLLLLIGACTTLGYAYSPDILAPLSTRGMAFFQAFVAGSLMHVLVHRPHSSKHCSSTRAAWPEGLGNLLGAGLVIYLASHHTGGSELAWLHEAGMTLLNLALESAPALLLAYLIAGLAVVFMPTAYVEWLGRGRPLGQSLRGVAVGLPLPVCSCGVVPLYHTLIRRGAPPTAAMAFLIATPELGIDAVLLSLPLLGGEMTVIRVLAAALVALTVGVVVGRLTPAQQAMGADHSTSSDSRQSLAQRLQQGLRFGLVELVDHTGPWIVAGLLLAALAQPLLAGGLVDGIPAGLAVPMFALIGMPVYVCASGATPLVAVLLFNGVSPGAALAFLITGPATNLTTLGVLSGLHGRRIALIFAGVTFTATICLGYLTDALLSDFNAVDLDPESHAHSTLQWLALGALSTLYLASLLRRGARASLLELFAQGGPEPHTHHSH